MNRKIVFGLILGFSFMANAKVRLQPMFSDNMVLQQQTSAPLWGEAAPNKLVTLTTSWDGHSYSVKADSKGQWKINVSTPKAGGPYDITISDGKPLTLHNVLIGEVWLCGGQSNMEMPMQGWDIKMNADEIAQSGKFKNIRLLQVDELTSNKQQTAVSVKNNGWMTCSSETVKDFSATGFFFGKNIHLKENVPVGLIMSCWGGTPIESWISEEVLKTRPAFSKRIAEIDSTKNWIPNFWMIYNNLIADKVREEGSYNSKGKCVFAQVGFDDSKWMEMTEPVYIEKAGLPGYDGYVWFRKAIDIPKSWAGKDLELDLGKIDDNDQTYFNGEEVGHTNFYSVNRQYTVPARLVKAGKAVITVRCLDNSGDGGFWGEAKDMKIGVKGSDDVISLAGVWKAKPTFNTNKVEKHENQKWPTTLYNSMINPLIPYAIRGAIWYQGEDNSARAYQYRDLLPMMIQDWRARWGYEFPFYIMQLANYETRHDNPVDSEWAELREAQLMTAKNVANTAMAVNIDIGMADNIHPIKKYEVGRRLALLAEALTYNNKDVEYSGPMYEGYNVENGKIRVFFSHTSGMKAKDGGALKGFAIAGPDKQFHWADAKIDGNSIIVSCKDVSCPLAVRYAWDDNPDCNLVNASGLPASPFRTDEWQGLTFGKE